MRASWVNIPPDARWNLQGQTVGGQSLTFSDPRGIFIAEDGTIYIADRRNHRIVVWREGGTQEEVVAGGLGGERKRAYRLSEPSDMIVDEKNDSLLICDRRNRRVVRWHRRNGTQGDPYLSNIHCWGLTMDEERSLYVGDTDKHEVRRYRTGESHGTIVAGGKGRGNGLNQLNFPYYLFVDREHSVYVSDGDNHRVMKWTVGAKEGVVVAGVHGLGSSLSHLKYPRGVLVDQLDTVYVADSENNRVVRWTKGAQQGTVVAGGNGGGIRENQLKRPEGLAFDRHGQLYVVDRNNNRVQKFTLETLPM